MCLLNLQMVDYLKNVIAHNVKIITRESWLHIFGEAMVTQIEQQKVEKRGERLCLVAPGGNGTPCAMDKDEPGPICTYFVDLII